MPKAKYFLKFKIPHEISLNSFFPFLLSTVLIKTLFSVFLNYSLGATRVGAL
jgi:hypothetical protein